MFSGKQKWLLLLVAVLGIMAGYGAVAKAWPSPSYVGYFHARTDGSHSGSSVWPNNSGPTPSSYNGIFGYVGNSFQNSEVHINGCQGSGGLAIPTWVDTPQDFIDFVMCKSIWGNTQEHIGAMFIVGTIMGINNLTYLEDGANFFNVWADDSSSPNPTAAYPGSFPSRVKYAALQGWIDWSYNPGFGSCPADMLPNTYYNPSVVQPDEYSFTGNCGNSEMRSIKISFPGGTYHLKRYCANPMGTMPALPQAQTATASCSSVTVVASKPDPTDAYTVTAIVNTTGGSAGAQSVITGGGKFYINVSGPGVNSSNSDVTPVTVGSSGANGTLTASRSMSATNNAGVYTVSYGLTGGVAVSCSGTFTVTFTPYFSVMGGDVAAGPGFGTCTPELSTIKGSNLGASSGYYGAGSQLAAFGLGQNTSFATNTTLGAGTGSSSSGASATQPSGLAFSNNGAAGTVFGTAFGNSSWCAPDYYAAAVTGATSLGSNTLTQALLNGLTSGTTYYVNGNLTISGPIKLGGASPKRIKIVVTNGNVTIDSDGTANSGITYNSYNYVAGTSSVNDIPQFQLLVRGGNIFIDKSVTQLNGFYHAQRTGADTGTIFTCAATVSGSPKYLTNTVGDAGTYASTDASYYINCSKPLTIYGSVAAYAFKLNRTGGHWKTAGSVTNQPAERIIYAPELWLGTLTSTLPSTPQYDAITSLPPIL